MNEILNPELRKYHQTPEKIKALKNTEIYLDNVITAVREIINGKSESSVCHKYNIDKDVFRKLIFSRKLGYKSSVPSKPEEYTMNPSEKLYCDIINITNKNAVNYKDIPYDIDETMSLLLTSQTVLSKREYSVIEDYYYNHMTHSEIGKKLNVSNSSIQQSHQNALQKLHSLCTPDAPYCDLITYGKKYVEYKTKLRKETADAIRAKQYELLKIQEHNIKTKAIEDLEKQCYQAIKNNDAMTIEKCYLLLLNLLDDTSTAFMPKTKELAMSIPIEILNLSLRAYNSLKRMNVHNLYELSNLTFNKLLSMKGMGNLSAHEVCDKLTRNDLLNSDIASILDSDKYLKKSKAPLINLDSADTLRALTKLSIKLAHERK